MPKCKLQRRESKPSKRMCWKAQYYCSQCRQTSESEPLHWVLFVSTGVVKPLAGGNPALKIHRHPQSCNASTVNWWPLLSSIILDSTRLNYSWLSAEQFPFKDRKRAWINNCFRHAFVCLSSEQALPSFFTFELFGLIRWLINDNNWQTNLQPAQPWHCLSLEKAELHLLQRGMLNLPMIIPNVTDKRKRSGADNT